MIHRIIYEDWPLIFPVVALLVAAMVYAVAGWRANELGPTESGRLGRPPFDGE